jgi:hypothetical protein
MSRKNELPIIANQFHWHRSKALDEVLCFKAPYIQLSIHAFISNSDEFGGALRCPTHATKVWSNRAMYKTTNKYPTVRKPRFISENRIPSSDWALARAASSDWPVHSDEEFSQQFHDKLPQPFQEDMATELQKGEQCQIETEGEQCQSCNYALRKARRRPALASETTTPSTIWRLNLFQQPARLFSIVHYVAVKQSMTIVHTYVAWSVHVMAKQSKVTE